MSIMNLVTTPQALVDFVEYIKQADATEFIPQVQGFSGRVFAGFVKTVNEDGIDRTVFGDLPLGDSVLSEINNLKLVYDKMASDKNEYNVQLQIQTKNGLYVEACVIQDENGLLDELTRELSYEILGVKPIA